IKLFFDTANSQKTIVGLDNQRWQFETKEFKSQKLLVLIDQILKKNKKSLKDLTEIKVNLGPGSFTGLRVGGAVANTLSGALKISFNDNQKGELGEPQYD